MYILHSSCKSFVSEDESEAGEYRFTLQYSQSPPDQVVRLVASGSVAASQTAPGTDGQQVWSIDVSLPESTPVEMTIADAATTQINELQHRVWLRLMAPVLSPD